PGPGDRTLPLTAGKGGGEPAIDKGLHRRVAGEHVGLFEPSEGRLDGYRAQLGVELGLVVGFEPVGHHDVGAAGDDLLKDAGVVVVDHHLGTGEIVAGNGFVGGARVGDDPDPRSPARWYR